MVVSAVERQTEFCRSGIFAIVVVGISPQAVSKLADNAVAMRTQRNLVATFIRLSVLG
jgi:hypothetical protein